MLNRKFLLSGIGATILALVLVFNNCSSQKGPSDLDQALSSTSGDNEDTNNNVPNTSGLGDSAVPAGAILPMATASCPAGWIAADGSEQLRSAFTRLFNALGTTYGAGDGSTTFKLPDYRGMFLRGTDSGTGVDPNAAARTDRGDGTTGDNVGTKQNDQLGSHTHSISGIYGAASPGGGDTIGGSPRFGMANTSAAGGSETRPKNISVLYCISTGGQ